MSGKSAQLLQALIDKDVQQFEECLRDKTLKTWINNTANTDQVINSNYNEDLKYDTCLGYACANSKVDIVKRLVEEGADVTVTDAFNNTPLHAACWSKVDRLDKVQFLLEHDASLAHAKDRYDVTPLHDACEHGHSDVISILVKHGTGVNASGEKGRTALHLAAQFGFVDCIHELMKHGADVDACDGDTLATPLHLAVESGHMDCIQALVNNHSADINAANAFGYTPLHAAVCEDVTDVVKLLTSYPQCDVTVKTNQRQTAAVLARSTNHIDIADYLNNLAAGKLDKTVKVYGTFLRFIPTCIICMLVLFPVRIFEEILLVSYYN